MRKRIRLIHRRRGARVLPARTCIALIVFIFFCHSLIGAGPNDTVSGTVVDHRGPLPDVRVRVQGTEKISYTDREGRFALSGVSPGQKINLSAWKDGYYSAILKDVRSPQGNVSLKLVRYQIDDNPKYEWISPEGVKGSCAECHPSITKMSLKDAHMQAARNPLFLTMYTGTDMKGNRSPLTRYGRGTLYSPWSSTSVPLYPDESKAYYGPGYLLDFPNTAGNCSSCHIPGASISRSVNPKTVKGADRYGIHCDFCHKVADVHVDPVTKMANDRVPGVNAMRIKRPYTTDRERPQLFFGTFEDVNAPEGDTNLPLLKESRFCASCHVGTFWDTLVYNSYGEWLKSPYADPKSGKAKTCQECHMPSPTLYRDKPITNVAPGKGGIERNPAAIHNHNMTVDEQLLKNSLTMTASAKKNAGKIEVAVSLANDKTGHHVPTDSPLRHLILIVEAKDAGGRPLERLGGPVLPYWCGRDNLAKGHYAGLPGKAYAKLLKEKWTGIFPTGAYWNHTELVSDNRIAAFASDNTTWSFAAPESGRAIVSVRVLYRRAFIELMEQKKWDKPDILMASKTISIR